MTIMNTLRMPWMNSVTSAILIWTKKNSRTKKNTETRGVMTGRKNDVDDQNLNWNN